MTRLALLIIFSLAAQGRAQWVHARVQGTILDLHSFGPYLFAGTAGFGIHRSNDGGGTWVQAEPQRIPPYNLIVYAMASVESGLIIGTQGYGAFLSEDSGKSWLSINEGLVDSRVYALASSGRNVIAGTSTGTFRSHNGGLNWNPSPGLAGSYVQCLAFSGNLLFAGTVKDGVFFSGDGGVTWIRHGNDLLDIPVFSLAPAPGGMLAGTDRGLYASADSGRTWKRAGEGFPGDAVICLLSAGGVIYAGTDTEGVFASADGGARWTSLGLRDTSVHALGVHGGKLLAGTYGDGIAARPEVASTSIAGRIIRVVPRFSSWAPFRLDGKRLGSLIGPQRIHRREVTFPLRP